jgi:hypothetical protein
MFFAGVLHALEVIQGNGSMIGIVDDEDYR